MVPEVEAARVTHQPVWELPPNLQSDRQESFKTLWSSFITAQATFKYAKLKWAQIKLPIKSQNVLRNRFKGFVSNGVSLDSLVNNQSDRQLLHSAVNSRQLALNWVQFHQMASKRTQVSAAVGPSRYMRMSGRKQRVCRHFSHIKHVQQAAKSPTSGEQGSNLPERR